MLLPLGWPGSGGVSMAHQFIASFLTKDFYIGSLGLSPRSINISSLNDQFPSLLGTLSQEDIIPSTSWGYLAGASYYSYPVWAFGSLTFGGYDSTRLDLKNNLTLVEGADE